MKVLLPTLTFLILAFLAHGNERIAFTLPEGVDHKIENIQGKEIHLFRLEKDPTDPKLFNPALPTLMFFETTQEQYFGFEKKIEGKSSEEIEAQIAKRSQSEKINVDRVEYSMVSLDELQGHKVTTYFSFDFEGETHQKISQNNILKSEDGFWFGNGVSLTTQAHIETVELILKSIKIR